VKFIALFMGVLMFGGIVDKDVQAYLEMLNRIAMEIIKKEVENGQTTGRTG